ncbi:hypothetical protein KL86CLO1_11700 [uncultured Eubacteriales bacterium]|uniref:Uncharacterized protein n=1 Tax=uncultured Eubacteriales bacterium TaxID=172733 RepID=A0A212JTR0_9FIRM|nr:hypothetical protein KL86CLO1_11700 [uncultured Eubacteriales bacterium]
MAKCCVLIEKLVLILKMTLATKSLGYSESSCLVKKRVSAFIRFGVRKNISTPPIISARPCMPYRSSPILKLK